MADLLVSDAVLEGAIGHIVTGSGCMVDGNAPRPAGGFESLTGIAGEVELFLRGLQAGRASLADAGRSAGQGLRSMMQEVSALDASLASSLSAGFAVRGKSS